MEYAIVDIETTGGYAAGCGITEIAIYIHDGERVTQRYETLINPETPIPYFITRLTGIDNNMVSSAPKFNEVAQEIYDLLKHRIFVAHSVNFDFSFVKNTLKESGFNLQSPKLCTVRLSRKIFPGLPSYSLGNLCNSLDIPVYNRHRAGGDTEATSILFSMLMRTDAKSVLSFLKRGSKDHSLPPHLSKSEFEQLPYSPGVYYFLDRKGKVIYVGKAVNLKKRVSGHFTNNSPGKQKQDFIRDIHHITFTETRTEEEAFQLETAEIKKLWPLYNRAQKGYEPFYALVDYTDQNGFIRLAVKRLRKISEPGIRVNSLLEGHEYIRRVVTEHKLCLRLCGIKKSIERCRKENCICSVKDNEAIAIYNQAMKLVLQALKDYGYSTDNELPTPTFRESKLGTLQLPLTF